MPSPKSVVNLLVESSALSFCSAEGLPVSMLGDGSLVWWPLQTLFVAHEAEGCLSPFVDPHVQLLQHPVSPVQQTTTSVYNGKNLPSSEDGLILSTHIFICK